MRAMSSACQSLFVLRASLFFNISFSFLSFFASLSFSVKVKVMREDFNAEQNGEQLLSSHKKHHHHDDDEEEEEVPSVMTTLYSDYAHTQVLGQVKPFALS